MTRNIHNYANCSEISRKRQGIKVCWVVDRENLKMVSDIEQGVGILG